MAGPDVIETTTRPICQCDIARYHYPARCRKKATTSYDGVWLCLGCEGHSPVVLIVEGKPIIHVRR